MPAMSYSIFKVNIARALRLGFEVETLFCDDLHVHIRSQRIKPQRETL